MPETRRRGQGGGGMARGGALTQADRQTEAQGPGRAGRSVTGGTEPLRLHAWVHGMQKATAPNRLLL